MRSAIFLVGLLAVASPVAAQRQALGIFFNWGAFREETPKRCFAIAEPERGPKPDGWRPFASVSFWPASGARSQVHFRLSRNKRPGSAVLLRIDDRTFQLFAGGIDAWAADRRADAEIVAAMRRGIDMTIETRSDRGALVRDYYHLRGAATAIDAAAIGCARPRQAVRR
jgi:hypothetical protein